MTQTLRRELRNKFEDILTGFEDKLTLPEREPLAELLADAALSVSGIARRTDETKGNYTSDANKKIDALLDMANFAGAKAEARRNSILSYLGETFHVNTETKAWREFAKYADGQQQKDGQDIKVFVAWVRSQKGFDLQFWPPSKMQERWPGAFVKVEKKEDKFKDGSAYV